MDGAEERGRESERSELWEKETEKLIELLKVHANDRATWQQFQEASLLEAFSQTHANVYSFEHKHFSDLLSFLVSNRLHERALVRSGAHDELFRLLQAVRVLVRDTSLMLQFASECSVHLLSQLTFALVEQHLSSVRKHIFYHLWLWVSFLPLFLSQWYWIQRRVTCAGTAKLFD